MAQRLEVLQGLKPTDLIVINPADSLDDGVQVNVKQIAQPALPRLPVTELAPPVGKAMRRKMGRGHPAERLRRIKTASQPRKNSSWQLVFSK